MLKHAAEHDAQAYAPSIQLGSAPSNALRTYARTYVRTTHLLEESHVEYRAQGGSTK